MRILVVEDDRLLNNTLCYNLNTAGYAVDSALTKSAAGSFLTEQDYDLIVLDVNLPDGNGFDFCREVKERRPDTAIIFLTANDMESDMLKGYELGAEDYVTKPFPTVTPVLGEKAAHNGKVVYSLDFEVTPHQLRHTYITNLIHASVDPKTVQYLAGHESSKITMDIYAKVKYNRPDELVRSMNCAFASWDAAQ